MAKPKTPKAADKPTDDNTASAAEVRDSVAGESKHTDHELYGAVKPTMVNGVYVGEDKPAKKAPTLAERIAGAFTNQAQIDVVLAVLAVASGKAPADETAVGALSPDVEAEVKQLRADLETLRAQCGLDGDNVDEHLQELDARALQLDNRLTALENQAPVETPPES